MLSLVSLFIILVMSEEAPNEGPLFLDSRKSGVQELQAGPTVPGFPEEDSIGDIDTIFHGLQPLRVYCFPKPKPFIWITCVKKFLSRPPGNAEDYANCTVEFDFHLLEHTEANREENTRVTFDDSGEGSLAELRRAQHRLNKSKYLNRHEPDDTKPVLCKAVNLIEFAPQNYLKRFVVCLRFDLLCIKEHDDKTCVIVHSNQQRMKVYSFVRST